jgi:hypothetical protein
MALAKCLGILVLTTFHFNKINMVLEQPGSNLERLQLHQITEITKQSNLFGSFAMCAPFFIKLDELRTRRVGIVHFLKDIVFINELSDSIICHSFHGVLDVSPNGVCIQFMPILF